MHHYKGRLLTLSLHVMKTFVVLSYKHHYPTFRPIAPDLLTINSVTMLENHFFLVWPVKKTAGLAMFYTPTSSIQHPPGTIQSFYSCMEQLL